VDNHDAKRLQYQAVFLPWTPFDWKAIGSSLRVGRVVFQPFDSFTTDPQAARFLTRYFERYRDLQNRPVQTITLCHYAPEDIGFLTPLNGQQLQEIRDAVNLLLFCAVWEELCEFLATGFRVAAPPNAETFEIVVQAFTDETLQTETPYIALSTHGMLHTDELENFWFSVPRNAHLRGEIRLELSLVNLLQSVFYDEFPQQQRDRILRSLEWFRIASQKDYPVPTQIVSIATALETLLAPNERQIKRTLADAVDEWLRRQWGEWAIEEQRDEYSRTAAGFWMWDFYNLRNQIVHGKPITEEELFSLVPVKCGHETRSVAVSKADVASFMYGILLIDGIIRLGDSSDSVAIANDDASDEATDVSLWDTLWKVDDALANLGWRRRLEDDPQAMRLYLQTVLGELLEPLSSESLVRERNQERPEPVVEDSTKG
jgi:hypothetical protein